MGSTARTYAQRIQQDADQNIAHRVKIVNEDEQELENRRLALNRENNSEWRTNKTMGHLEARVRRAKKDLKQAQSIARKANKAEYELEKWDLALDREKSSDDMTDKTVQYLQDRVD